MMIAVGGHVCLDIIPDWHQGSIDAIVPGNLIELDGVELSTGGAVPNTGLALKKLGVETSLVGKVGEDHFGRIILDILQEEDENAADSMIVSSGEISSYTVLISPPGTDRIIFHYPGTNNSFSTGDIPYDDIKKNKLFHFGYPPLMANFYKNDGAELEEMMAQIKKRGLVTSLDMALPDPDSPAGKIDWQKLLKRVLPYIDVFLPSVDELAYMVDKDIFKALNQEQNDVTTEILSDLADTVLEWGNKIVVIKLGDQGLYMKTANMNEILEGDKSAVTGNNGYNQELIGLIDIDLWSKRELLSPCFNAEVVGTAGAGDTTIAGFLAKFIEGDTIPEEVMTAATGVGAFSVEAVSATGGIKSLQEVEKRIKEGWNKLPVDIDLKGWKYDEEYKLWHAAEDG